MIEEIRNKIVEIAKSYEGIKETGRNQGFEKNFVSKELIGVGWKEGWAYCAFSGKLIWSKAYGHFDSSVITELQDLFNPSATKTFYNFKKSKDFETYSDKSFEKGDLIIWQKYNNGIADWRGHLGIVLASNEEFITTLEGNTNKKGSRSGDGFYINERPYNFSENNGLRLKGGIKPKNI